MTMKGALVAASVAGLFASAFPLVASAKTTDNVKCMGINSCSGKGSGKSANNACAGKNGCKGKGITATTSADCKTKGGTVVADAKK